MTTPLSSPPRPKTDLGRVAILFSGGPAPAANAVIASAAELLFQGRHRRARHPQRLLAPDGVQAGQPTRRGRSLHRCSTTRTSRAPGPVPGIMIGTARANPGKQLKEPKDLDDPDEDRPSADGLRRAAVAGRRRLDFHRRRRHAHHGRQVQALPGRLPEDKQANPRVHLPKTIDNDYQGIDFTFGYFTAVEMLATRDAATCWPTPCPTAPTSSPR